MTTVASILSLTSGFALMGYQGSTANLIATSIIIDLALAPLTSIIALRRGRSWVRWAVAGVALGAWALAAVMIIRVSRHDEPRSVPPPSYHGDSDAA